MLFLWMGNTINWFNLIENKNQSLEYSKLELSNFLIEVYLFFALIISINLKKIFIKDYYLTWAW